MGGSRSHSEFFFLGGNRPKIALNQYCLHRAVGTLLKVVGYYDLSVLSMSVMGFIQVFFGIFEKFNFAKRLTQLNYIDLRVYRKF